MFPTIQIIAACKWTKLWKQTPTKSKLRRNTWIWKTVKDLDGQYFDSYWNVSQQVAGCKRHMKI